MKLFEFSIFGIDIAASWYGLMYAIGFLVCYLYIKKYGSLKGKHLDDFLLFIFIGVIGGGRIGYTILYQASYFWSHPLEIFMVWKGGMSFHGGAIGVIGSLILFSYKYRYKLYDLSDTLVFILPFALGLGRIGNYLNGELLGYTPYDGIWPMIENGVAHFPSPLFQAFLEGIVLLMIMQIYRWYEKKNGRIPGYASALFLVSYALLRIVAESLRLPDENIGYLLHTHWMTLGMLYSVPMIILGAIVFIDSSMKRPKNS